MKKLIELDAALSAIWEVPTYNDGMVFEALSHAQRDVELLPTVDAVPIRHGRWIWWIWWDYPEYKYQCDQCKRWAMSKSKFCPNCGALMDGEQI